MIIITKICLIQFGFTNLQTTTRIERQKCEDIGQIYQSDLSI